jgi:hypothetical protein
MCLVHVVVAQFNSEQYKAELNSIQKSLQDIQMQIAVEQNRIEELKGQIAVADKNYRLNAESGYSGDGLEANLREISDLPLEQKKVIQAQGGSKEIAPFLTVYDLNCDDLRVSGTAGSGSLAGRGKTMNTISSVHGDPARWSDIYILIRNRFPQALTEIKKRIESTIQPFRFSFSKLSADYYNIRADK